MGIDLFFVVINLRMSFGRRWLALAHLNGARVLCRTILRHPSGTLSVTVYAFRLNSFLAPGFDVCERSSDEFTIRHYKLPPKNLRRNVLRRSRKYFPVFDCMAGSNR